MQTNSEGANATEPMELKVGCTVRMIGKRQKMIVKGGKRLRHTEHVFLPGMPTWSKRSSASGVPAPEGRGARILWLARQKSFPRRPIMNDSTETATRDTYKR